MERRHVVTALGVGAAVVAVGAAAYVANGGCGCTPKAAGGASAAQSVRLPRERANESEILRNAVRGGELVARYDASVATLYDVFQAGLATSRHGPCYGFRAPSGGPYQWVTYEQVFEMAQDVGSALQYLDIATESNVGVYSVNRIEWGYVLQACGAYSYSLVSLYDTLGAESTAHIVNTCAIELVFVSGATFEALRDQLATLKSLKYIIHFDMDDGDAVAYDNVQCMSFERFRMLGRHSRKPVVPPTPETVASIQFTSGTTGLPKGVVSTHGQCVAEVSGALLSLDNLITARDVHISYLPLAHSFERVVQYVMVSRGGAIGFFRGDVKKHLMDDLLALRPTLFCSVPRLFNRLYDAATAKMAELEGVKKRMMEHAWATKKANLAHGQVSHWLWDRLVFSKVAASLGGRVRVMLSGSAPIDHKVKEFLAICFSADVREGYGQTECVGGCSLSLAGDGRSAHVGPPMACNEVKLLDVPEMNYRASDKPLPRGELCIRGHNVMSGYYKDEERTRAALDEDGWLHTGDIAAFDELGCIVIVDRVKSLFKLSQGEYISPEKVELVCVKSPYVLQAFVHGDSTCSHVVAAFVVDAAALLPWAAERGLGDDVAQLVKRPEVHELVAGEVQRLSREAKLNSLETVRSFVLSSEELTVASGALTPSLKLVRRVALEQFREAFDALYAESS